MKEQNNRSEITIGLDLGERRHRFCALNGRGEVVEEGTLGNDRASLARLTARYRGALAVMEAEAHSPWISRYLEGLGWEVIVSNPRKVRAIYQHERKSDRRDALDCWRDRFALFLPRLRCSGSEFLEALIIPERIEHWIEPEQRGSERRNLCEKFALLFRCERGDDFLKARIAAERVPVRQQF